MQWAGILTAIFVDHHTIPSTFCANVRRQHYRVATPAPQPAEILESTTSVILFTAISTPTQDNQLLP